MPTVAKTNASGTARPTRPTVPCGLMFAAIDGAISAIEMPTASQSERLPRRRLRASPFEPSVTCAMGPLPDRGSPADYRTTNGLRSARSDPVTDDPVPELRLLAHRAVAGAFEEVQVGGLAGRQPLAGGDRDELLVATPAAQCGQLVRPNDRAEVAKRLVEQDARGGVRAELLGLGDQHLELRGRAVVGEHRRHEVGHHAAEVVLSCLEQSEQLVRRERAERPV